jgi:DNA gyrase subunit A
MREVIVEELGTIKQAYGDPRRTVIVDSMATHTTNAADLLVPEEVTWVTFTVEGKMGRSYENKAPKVTQDVKEPPRFILHSSTTQVLYLFTRKGQCATIPVQQLPQVYEPAEGVPFNTLSALKAQDEVTAILSIPNNLETGFLFLVAENGDVKRIRIEDLPGMSSNAFTVMNVGDSGLGWVFPTDGQREILLVSFQGQAIRFNEDEVRPTGLPAGGMRGIKLAEQRDSIVGAAVVVPDEYVWTITDNGLAKISALTEYPSQGRAGSGVLTMRLPNDSKGIAASVVGKPDDNIVLLTTKDKPKYMRIGLAPKQPRAKAGGDYIISLGAKEAIKAVVVYQERITVPEIEPESE